MDHTDTTSTDSALSLWLDKPLPRYTSYPPAPFFRDDMTGKDYEQSLATLPASQPISLYIHIPFCREMCLFCGCHTMITRRDDRIRDYLAKLALEMKLVAAASPHKLTVSHLHFGGGTPNILSPQDLTDLFAALRATFDFTSRSEIAMELDPRTLDDDKIAAMAKCGITRASLGVQDFNADVQKTVHRIQPYDMVAQTCASLRAAKISRINFDLMYGLPGQTEDSVAETTRQALTLRPDRIALFSYAHVPHFKIHQQALNALRIPTGLERLSMERAAREILRNAGYIEIGMDHFALPHDNLALALHEKRLHRNFQGYTNDTAPTLVALGASAIGFTPHGYFQNEKDIGRYQTMVANKTLPISRGLALTAEDRLRGEIIERLMCDLACDVKSICRKHNATLDAFASTFDAMRPFEQAGLMTRKDYVITLQGPYRMAIRALASLFDAYVQPPASRAYSRVA
ncbi:MAG: oxygen-independent coproporphyrinogen III oxidase [Bdellovibrionales bacterium]